MSCSAAKSVVEQASPMQPIIDQIAKQFAPDSRTALFQVTASNNILKGETNLPEAKTALLQQLANEGFTVIDSIDVLPTADMEGFHHAVVNVSVANLRTQGRHPAELATQATLGTPLKLLKFKGGWLQVQTPDQYIAWVDGGGITLMKDKEFAQWQEKTKLIYTKPYGFVYAKMNADSATISDLVYGDVLAYEDRIGDYYKVNFPDGRVGFILRSESQMLRDWAAQRNPTQQNFVETAKRLTGLPYLWGGTSFKGVDCSGFTKTVFFMNGLVLPRDASQQAQVGELVSTQNGWDYLQPGDLLFFGVPAKDGKAERVVHVGMWIGNKEFIHSSKWVRISSVDPAAPNFEESELKRFLYAKRIKPQESLYDFRVKSYY